MEISQQQIPVILEKYKKELDDELMDILLYWIQHTLDRKKGGFYGAVDFNDVPDKKAPKGIVLNSRILWTFSAATLFGLTEYEVIADRAFDYIKDHFRDGEYGGVYWSLSSEGKGKEYKKQIYGQAFCIYGLSEYYKLSENPEALKMAVELFVFIEKYSYDEVNGGYVEAFTRDWKEIADLRLSDKDENEKKTMNTHLHIIEAYANLYKVWKDESLLKRIKDLLSIFNKIIIDSTSDHLHLFMNEEWKVSSSSYSFGHDIEAAWLLLECAESIADAEEIALFKKHAVSLSIAASEGLDQDGGLFHEINFKDQIFLKEKHWWPQAEALVGFFNTWKITGDNSWLLKSLNVWEFVKKHLKDVKNGEWFWGIDENGQLMKEDKAGFWKCPYHNARACMAVIKRIEKLEKTLK